MTTPNDTYLTVCAQEGETPVYKEKGSRFLGYAFHVETPEAVQDILRELRAQHHAARHVCYAYRLGASGAVFRAGDDGEPSGTAGLPIYNQLLSFRTTDTLVAVVRYFGGILLGASGLVAAYKQAARMALETSRIEQRIVCRKLEVRFDYGQISAVMRMVKERGLDLLEQDLRADCRIRVAVRASAAEAVRGALEAIFGVKVSQEPD